MDTNVKTKNPNPGKAFELLGEIHNHLHNKVIGHELFKIASHTKDKEIREICKQAANCLEIRINTDFHRIDYEQCKKSLTTLVRHSSDWLVQEHLPKSIPYSDVEDRIKASRKIHRRVWNKVSYNCEHWAREMFTGQAKCTQLKQRKEDIRNKNNKS